MTPGSRRYSTALFIKGRQGLQRFYCLLVHFGSFCGNESKGITMNTGIHTSFTNQALAVMLNCCLAVSAIMQKEIIRHRICKPGVKCAIT